ncbi:Flp family type IVb pilin [Thermosediminibacter litoriperuensis]|uniref:Pilus assembly protein Flp/PilA n=1 Tax=Thermosediminibacter litoriperuensis TaxID=291989 RepID=A0A5S5AQ44_9FIRM|nr:Flp family type IVb pilin [Thermosediminibacter litoriperuensis]TYP53767.1 pilus assembly protein Flp/PilA [Thermosediminibacter litoriperuensis]
MLGLIRNLWADQEGQAMAEYGLILALVAVVVIIALTTLGNNIKARFEEVGNTIGPNSSQ